MPQVKIKGHQINAMVIRDSFYRRALQCKNNICLTLRKLDLTQDDIDIEVEPVAIKKLPASATWFFEGQRLYYSYAGASKYVENLYVVSKVIEMEVNELISGRKTVEEFIREFSEDKDIEAQRKQARELLGIPENSLDMDLIDKKYKDLAKELHPDMPNGDLEKFKAVNRAHKLLKRALT